MIDQFAYCINSYREAAMSNDTKFDHIDVSEKQKVMDLLHLSLSLLILSVSFLISHFISPFVGLE